MQLARVAIPLAALVHFASAANLSAQDLAPADRARRAAERAEQIQILRERNAAAAQAAKAAEAEASAVDAAAAQDAAKKKAVAQQTADAKANPTSENSDEETAGSSASEQPSHTPQQAVDPQLIRLTLVDGSIISGKFTIQDITVATRFGELQIPIESIKSFQPGLDSFPERSSQIAALLESLQSEDYAEREDAKKQLLKIGPPLTTELRQRKATASSEVAKHLDEILAEFEKQEQAADADFDSPEPAWIRADAIVTTDFTVTGEISPKSFELVSPYGPLKVELSDIRSASRSFEEEQGPIRKRVEVEGQHLSSQSFKNSGIKVAKGDRVSITAEGSIAMTPWGTGSFSSPDGHKRFGWYRNREIHNGALVAKISDSGQEFKVGSSHTFTADRPGTLQFAIGMQPQFGRHNNFPGKYELKVKVESK